MLLKDGNKHNIIVKNNSRVHRNDVNADYNSNDILGIAVEEGRGLAMYGNPEPLVVKIFSSEYRNNEQLLNFVKQYYENDILVDEEQEGYVLVIKRLVEIMCNL